MPSKKIIICCFLLFLMLAGCRQAPAEEVAVQELLLETDFIEPGAWPEEINVELGTAVQFTNSGYELSSASATYVWSFGVESYENAVLETTAQQLSREPNNAYGLVCRASSQDSPNGYYFLISGDGLVSIRRVERDLSSPIVDWQPHGAVRQGRRTNRLEALCIGEYLALYVNGQLVAEGTDGRFSQGFVGFAASGSEDGSVQVTFNNLTVHAAEIDSQ